MSEKHYVHLTDDHVAEAFRSIMRRFVTRAGVDGSELN